MIKITFYLFILFFPFIGQALSMEPVTPGYLLVRYIPLMSFLFGLFNFVLSFLIFLFIEKEKAIKYRKKIKFLGSFFTGIFSSLIIFCTFTLINVTIYNINIEKIFGYFNYEIYYFGLVFLMGLLLYYFLVKLLILYITNMDNSSASLWRFFFNRTLLIFPIRLLILFLIIFVPNAVLGMASTGYNISSDYNEVILIKEITKLMIGFVLLFLTTLYFRYLLLNKKTLEINE